MHLCNGIQGSCQYTPEAWPTRQAKPPAPPAWSAHTARYYTPSDSSNAATIFQFCGAGNFACSRLLGGSWLRLCCSVGQTISVCGLSFLPALHYRTPRPRGPAVIAIGSTGGGGAFLVRPS